jgi:hypothetical protein
MGGMEFPETRTLQNQTQIPFMIKQLRWDKTLANDILVTLDHVQLLSSFTTPVMQNTKIKINYIGTSYLVEMRRRLLEIEGTIATFLMTSYKFVHDIPSHRTGRNRSNSPPPRPPQYHTHNGRAVVGQQTGSQRLQHTTQ